MRSRLRRCAMVAFALAVSAFCLRAQVAQALVVRGDEFIYRNEPGQALKRYARAIAIDPASQTAADRYIFISMMLHRRSDATAGITAANRFLRHAPRNAEILFDRAMCLLAVHRYRQAERDFSASAFVSHDARSYVFAGWAALRAGERERARSLWRSALVVQPGFRPAAIALYEQHQ